MEQRSVRIIGSFWLVWLCVGVCLMVTDVRGQGDQLFQ